MSLATHVIGKGLKTLETELEDEESNINKMSYITEELLYRKLLAQHKSFMCFLLAFHFLLTGILVSRIFFSSILQEESFFCRNSGVIKNTSYLVLNFPLFLFALKGLSKNSAILSTISFYEKT